MPARFGEELIMNAEVDSATQAVERASGIPVIIQPDPSLKLIARMVVARNSAPAHLVYFNPKYGEATDYHIVFQCGSVLRIYHTPPELRFDIASTDSGRREVEQLVSDHLRRGKMNLTPQVGKELSQQFYDGLILQLRSIPVGMLVDRWIQDNYPTLADQQRASALRQLAENQRTLSAQVKAIAPVRVYNASMGMVAALAVFWARMLGDTTQEVPYKVGGHLKLGERLLSLLDSSPPDPASDRDLIQSWGVELGIQGWYTFTPFGG